MVKAAACEIIGAQDRRDGRPFPVFCSQNQNMRILEEPPARIEHHHSSFGVLGAVVQLTMVQCGKAPGMCFFKNLGACGRRVEARMHEDPAIMIVETSIRWV